MDKQDVLQQLTSTRADLLDAIGGLTDEQMRKPFAVGKWSVKDTLAHITAWESELVTALNKAQMGRKPHIVLIDDIDEWNDECYRENVRRPIAAIMQDLQGVHSMLYKMVDEMPEDLLIDNRKFDWMEGEALVYLIEENAIYHEEEHAEDIRAWRADEGL